VIYKSPKPSLYNNNTDWGLFKENVRNNLRLNISLKTEQEIEEATNDFIITIQRAAWAASPTITKITRNNVNIPHEILQLVPEKRRARAKRHRTRNPVDKNLYNRLTNNLKTKINAVKQVTYQHYVSQLSSTDNTIWKLARKGKSPQRMNPPIRKPTGEWA
jgi:DNA-binding transcriptional MocR family regulator